MARKGPRCWDKGHAWPGRDLGGWEGTQMLGQGTWVARKGPGCPGGDPDVGTRDLGSQEVTWVSGRRLRCWDKGPRRPGRDPGGCEGTQMLGQGT